MLFNFKTFIQDLRKNPEKKSMIDEYEIYYGKIDNNIKNQNWYIDYVSKFSPFYEVVNSPIEISEEFDWQLLFSLIVSSFSCDYKLLKPNRIIFDNNQKVDLEITINLNEQSIVKKIDELWSFQVLRLFEIYVEEQIKLQTVIAASDEGEMIDIYKERCNKLEYIKNYNHNLLKDITKSVVNHNIIYHYTNFNSFYNLLNSKTIWACDLKKLNDKKEYQIWFEIFHQAYMNIKNKEDSNDYLEIIEEINKM